MEEKPTVIGKWKFELTKVQEKMFKFIYKEPSLEEADWEEACGNIPLPLIFPLVVRREDFWGYYYFLNVFYQAQEVTSPFELEKTLIGHSLAGAVYDRDLVKKFFEDLIEMGFVSKEKDLTKFSPDIQGEIANAFWSGIYVGDDDAEIEVAIINGILYWFDFRD